MSHDAEMEILAALLNAQFGPAQVDAEQGAVLLQVRFVSTVLFDTDTKSPICVQMPISLF